MFRRTVLLIAGALVALVASGCGLTIENPKVEQTAPGTLKVSGELLQGLDDNDMPVRGRADVLLGFALPTGVTPPEEFTSTGDVVTTFRASPTYSAWLQSDSAMTGYTWFGYLSDDVTVSGDDELAFALPPLTLPAGGSPNGAVTIRAAGRRGDEAESDTVDCTAYDCNLETEALPYQLEGPEVTIRTPGARTQVAVGESFVPDFECSAPSTCTGTAPDGEPFGPHDTPGSFDFVVTGSDPWGAQTVRSRGYDVRGDVLTVNATGDADDGACAEHCSLRDAVAAANATDDVHELIRFAIPGDGVHRIELASPLSVNDAVTIDGYTQPGAAPRTAGAPPELRIELAPSAGTTAGTGMLVSDTAGLSRVRGLAIGGFSHYQIAVLGPSHLEGSYINRRADGTLVPSPGLHGVEARNQAVIGGWSREQGNVIAAQESGVIAGNGAIVQGNRIGTDPAGAQSSGRPNEGITGSNLGDWITVGGDGEAGNLISAGFGVRLYGNGTVYGNTIGEDADGEPFTPAPFIGVLLSGDAGEVGGSAGMGNRITARRGVVANASVGQASIAGNRLRGTGDSANGIDFVGDTTGLVWGNTMTGFGDRPIGRIAKPPLPSVSAVRQRTQGAEVAGSFEGGAASMEYRLDVYANATAGGEAERWVGSTTFTTDDTGAATFSRIIGGANVRDEFLRFTAQPRYGTGRVSEMTGAIQEGAAPVIATFAASGDESQRVGVSLTLAEDGRDQAEVAIDCDDDGTFDAGQGAGPQRSRYFVFDSCAFDTPGTKTVGVRVTDDDGATTTTRGVTVNDVTTAVTVTGPGSPDEGETATYTYTVAPATAEVTAESCGTGTKVDTEDEHSFGCTFPDGPATTSASVTVKDAEDAEPTTSTQAVTVSNVAPTLTLSGPDTSAEGETEEYTATVTDPGDDAIEISEGCGAGAMWHLDTEQGSMECTFFDSAGTDVTMIADDGDATGSDTISVSVANRGPSISIDGPDQVPQGERVTYTYDMEDPGRDPIVGEPVESCGSGATYVDTPADDSFDCTFAARGTAEVSVTATDGIDENTEELEVLVHDVPPVVDVTGPATAQQGQVQTYTYTVTSGDPIVGEPMEHCGENAQHVPDDAPNSFGCRFMGRPDAMVGVMASDGGEEPGFDVIQVTVSNAAPAVDLTGPATGEQGTTATYTYDATDPGGDELQVVESCGDGAILEDTPADESFDCTFMDRDGTTVSVSAADDGGGTDSATVAVTVGNRGPETAADAYATAYGTALTVGAPGVLANDTDAGDDALTATAGAEPANGTLTRRADGGFTYTPNAGFSGTDTFTYVATDGVDPAAAQTVTITVGADPAGAPPPSTPAPPAPAPPAPLPPPATSLTPAGFGSAAAAGVRIVGASRVSRAGVLQLRVENRNAFWLRGRAQIAAAKRTLGAKTAPLAPGKVTIVRVRIDRRTRAALRRGQSVRATVSLAVTDRAGATRRVGGRLTLRAVRR